MFKDFLLAFHDRDVDEVFFVSWSDLSPEALVKRLNDGKASWDISSEYIYGDKEEGIIAKAEAPYYGDIMDQLIAEKAFFIP
jgi:hypothetical protein